MMEGGDYESGFSLTWERGVATLLVALWVTIAYLEFGLVIAVRATVFYVVILTFIWIPDLIARMQIKGRNRDVGAIGPVSPKALRWVAWSFILGLPAAWFLFSRRFNT